MFLKLARMTDSVWYLITMNQLIIPKDVDGGGARMAQTVMPKVGGDGEVPCYTVVRLIAISRD